MDIQQARYFLCLAKHLNYTTSASELNISISTLSRQISALETELNVQLVIRNNKNVSLTQCGVYFQKELSKWYDSYKKIVQNTRQIYQGYSGSFTCGILEDITLNGIMQENFHNFIRNYPNCTVNLRRNSFRGLTDGLLDGSFDCIISFFFALDHMISFQYKVIEDIEEGFLISSKNRLAKEKYFSPEVFKNQTLITLESEKNEYMLRGPIEFCRQHGFQPKLLFAPDIDTVTLLVEAGIGISFTYGKSIGSYNPALKFIPIKKDDVMTFSPKLVLAWNRDNHNPSVQKFIKEFRGKAENGK